jgi:hypothetical protein
VSFLRGTHAAGFRAVRAVAARRPGSDGGGALLRTRDLMMLEWLGERYAARVDHLEVLLGAGQRTVGRVLARMREQGLLDTRRILVGEPAWVLPTRAGLRACSSPYRVWAPKVGQLAHVAAMNNVRLHIQARSPETLWIPERQLALEKTPEEHLPDGLAITQGRRVAIEVELTAKSHQRIQGILDELNARFDAVLYFCAPAPHRQLTRLRQTGRWPNLGVRELPTHPQHSR